MRKSNGLFSFGCILFPYRSPGARIAQSIAIQYLTLDHTLRNERGDNARFFSWLSMPPSPGRICARHQWHMLNKSDRNGKMAAKKSASKPDRREPEKWRRKWPNPGLSSCQSFGWVSSRLSRTYQKFGDDFIPFFPRQLFGGGSIDDNYAPSVARPEIAGGTQRFTQTPFFTITDTGIADFFSHTDCEAALPPRLTPKNQPKQPPG